MSIGESTVTKAVLAEVEAERNRQDEKWGEQNHPDGSSTAQYEGFALLAKQTCDKAAKEGKLTWALILFEEFYEALAEENVERLRKELVQVAAVTVGWIEAIDRRAKNKAEV